MVKLSPTKMLVTFGGLALALTAGVGVASADPDLGPLMNTTCSYSQVLAALQAKAPDMANALNADPQAQTGLRQFLNMSPDQRRQFVSSSGQTLPAVPPALMDVMSTCNNY